MAGRSVSGLAQGRRSRWLPGLAGGVGGRPQRARLDTRAGGDEHHRWLHGRVAFVRRVHGGQARGRRVGGRGHVIYRQMHYRDFYGKTVQLEFIVPMSRTTQEAPGAPRDRKSGIGDVTLGSASGSTTTTDQDLVRLGALHHGAGGPLRRLASDVSPGKNRWSTVQDFSFVQGVGESTFLERSPRSRSMAAIPMVRPDPEEGSVAAPVRAGLDQPDREHLHRRALPLRDRRARTFRRPDGDQPRAQHQLALELTHQINPSNQIQLQYIHDLKVENGRACAACRCAMSTHSRNRIMKGDRQ